MSTHAHPWEDLRKGYVRALQEPANASTWFEIWRLFLNDPWYRAELAKHARLVLHAGNAPIEWQEDLQHEAMLILAAKLRKKPHLDLDDQGLTERFPAAIGTIVHNECRQALKRLRRMYRTGPELFEESGHRAAVTFYEIQQRALDLSSLIDELPEPLCSVLRLSQSGYNIRQIASRLGLTYWETYRAFHRGVARLRDELGLS
jgi:DNA-directed RNA polymerase specialized sigma24 family protein